MFLNTLINLQNNVMEEPVANADTSDNDVAEANAELLPETCTRTVQDTETSPPSLCEAAPLESSPKVTSESEADGLPSTVDSSSNATAVTDASVLLRMKLTNHFCLKRLMKIQLNV